MKRIRDRVAGLDVHRDTVVACCRVVEAGGEVEVTKQSGRQIMGTNDEVVPPARRPCRGCLSHSDSARSRATSGQPRLSGSSRLTVAARVAATQIRLRRYTEVIHAMTRENI
jgi:hypothetical protein